MAINISHKHLHILSKLAHANEADEELPRPQHFKYLVSNSTWVIQCALLEAVACVTCVLPQVAQTNP